jgi:hypothetical protein
LDDAAIAESMTADVVFKPNCLGIETSIHEYSGNAESGSKIHAEHKLPSQA